MTKEERKEIIKKIDTYVDGIEFYAKQDEDILYGIRKIRELIQVLEDESE